MKPEAIAHARSWSRYRMILAWRAGNGCGRLEQRGAGSALDLSPQIARSSGRFGEHSRGMLELRARDLVPPKNDSAGRVLHRRVERRIGLNAPELAQREDERRIRHSEIRCLPAAATASESTEEGETERRPGAYHAGKARPEARRGQRRARLAGISASGVARPTKTTASRQRMGTNTADLALSLGIDVALPYDTRA